jgi:hypothetical protein
MDDPLLQSVRTAYRTERTWYSRSGDVQQRPLRRAVILFFLQPPFRIPPILFGPELDMFFFVLWVFCCLVPLLRTSRRPCPPWLVLEQLRAAAPVWYLTSSRAQDPLACSPHP